MPLDLEKIDLENFFSELSGPSLTRGQKIEVCVAAGVYGFLAAQLFHLVLFLTGHSLAGGRYVLAQTGFFIAASTLVPARGPALTRISYPERLSPEQAVFAALTTILLLNTVVLVTSGLFFHGVYVMLEKNWIGYSLLWSFASTAAVLVAVQLRKVVQ